MRRGISMILVLVAVLAGCSSEKPSQDGGATATTGAEARSTPVESAAPQSEPSDISSTADDPTTSSPIVAASADATIEGLGIHVELRVARLGEYGWDLVTKTTVSNESVTDTASLDYSPVLFCEGVDEVVTTGEPPIGSPRAVNFDDEIGSAASDFILSVEPLASGARFDVLGLRAASIPDSCDLRLAMAAYLGNHEQAEEIANSDPDDNYVVLDYNASVVLPIDLDGVLEEAQPALNYLALCDAIESKNPPILGTDPMERVGTCDWARGGDEFGLVVQSILLRPDLPYETGEPSDIPGASFFYFDGGAYLQLDLIGTDSIRIVTVSDGTRLTDDQLEVVGRLIQSEVEQT